MEGKPQICKKGFHFCENPLDVLNYYDLCDSEFSEVEAIGEVKKDDSKEKSKVVTNKIKIGAKLNLKGFINASFDFLFNLSKINEKSKELINNSRDFSKVATSGDSSQVATSGRNGIVANIGYKGMAKGIKGTWIVLVEYKQNKSRFWYPKNVKCQKVDGTKIKENTYYILENGKFVEMRED